MKGGITSGILYPPSICRIAEIFHLVGIGGTSAGAIAACAAAAAEYRRRHTGSGDGFERLEELPNHIAGKDDGTPLTFGDLRNAPKPPALKELECGEHQRSIDLRAVTTCVSYGRPLELLLENIDAPPTAKFGSNAQNQAAQQAIDDLLVFAAHLESFDGVCRPSDHNGEPCRRPFCGGPRPPIEIAGRARM